MIRKSRSFALIFFLAALAGCSTPLTTREKGAGIGALGGAAAGGIIGSTVGSAGAGAAVGGLLGLGAGALIGDQLQGHEMKEDEQQQRMDQQQREIQSTAEGNRQTKDRRILGSSNSGRDDGERFG